MKLGLGLYKHMLTPENFAFAKQAGATHIIAHFVDYFRGGAGHSATDDQPLPNSAHPGEIPPLLDARRAVEAQAL